MSETPTLIIKKLAQANSRAGENPHPQAIRRARKSLTQTVGGLVVALTAMAIALLMVVRTGEIPIPLLALCFMAAIFASGIMDKETLLALVRIMLKRE